MRRRCRRLAPVRIARLARTAGYAHLADGHLVEVAEKVGNIIAEAMVDGCRSPCLL